MLWWIAFLLTTQTIEIPSHEEVWGESTQSGITDWPAARENGRRMGLESVLREIWQKRATPHLFQGIPAAEVARIQKLLFRRPETYLIGLSQIQENRHANGDYTFRALYKIDTTALLWEIKRLLLFNRLQTVNLYAGPTEPPWISSDLLSRLHRPGLNAVLRKERFPEHCPVDFCLYYESKSFAEGWEARYLLRTTVQTKPAKPAKGKPAKPVSETRTREWTTTAPLRENILHVFPEDLVTVFQLPQARSVRIQAPANLDFSTWMQLVMQIQRQEPEIVHLKTIGLLSGQNAAVFTVRPGVLKRDVFMKGLYFGNDVKVTWKTRVDGIVELDITLPEIPLELKEKP